MPNRRGGGPPIARAARVIPPPTFIAPPEYFCILSPNEWSLMQTTRADFMHFQRHCHTFSQLLGCANYRIEFTHTPEDDCGTRASVSIGVESGSAVINLSRNWPNETRADFPKQLRLTAFHEICHIIFGAFSTAAWARFTTKDELVREEEAIIRRLEKLAE